jgi:hypothetical protein
MFIIAFDDDNVKIFIIVFDDVYHEDNVKMFFKRLKDFYDFGSPEPAQDELSESLNFCRPYTSAFVRSYSGGHIFASVIIKLC